VFLNHVGVINKNEEEAILFYQGFLGLDKIRDFIVSSELSHQLFGISQEIKVLVFVKETVKIEVFIYPEFSVAAPNIAHAGFFIDNLADLIDKARGKGIEVISGDHSGRTVYFVKDFSGNLIEIKQNHTSTSSG
jgi:catechol 2,3-dioxygenase-like lactoylglutathione lyase family enzyme